MNQSFLKIESGGAGVMRFAFENHQVSIHTGPGWGGFNTFAVPWKGWVHISATAAAGHGLTVLLSQSNAIADATSVCCTDVVFQTSFQGLEISVGALGDGAGAVFDLDNVALVAEK